MLVTSFAKLRSQPAGFDSSNVFVAAVSLPPSRYPDADTQGRFWLRVTEELKNAPGVLQAGLSSQPPLNGGFARAPYAVSEGAVPPLNERPLGLTMSVTPGYFATLRIPIVSGRDFTERDTGEAPLVAIVSKSTSRRLGGEEIAQLWSDCLRSDFGPSSATLADRGPVITARNGKDRHHD